MLAALRGQVLSGPSPPPRRRAFCPDPPGRDVVLTPAEMIELACGDCKKLCVLEARRLIDEGGCRSVELCMTVTDDPEEHVFLRVDGRFRDPAAEAGMPVRTIGAFLAEPVWTAP